MCLPRQVLMKASPCPVVDEAPDLLSANPPEPHIQNSPSHNKVRTPTNIHCCANIQNFESKRIVTSVIDSIRNEHNYSKFLNTYRHQFLTYLTE